jgi:hypothetical protein
VISCWKLTVLYILCFSDGRQYRLGDAQGFVDARARVWVRHRGEWGPGQPSLRQRGSLHRHLRRADGRPRRGEVTVRIIQACTLFHTFTHARTHARTHSLTHSLMHAHARTHAQPYFSTYQTSMHTFPHMHARMHACMHAHTTILQFTML